MTYPQLCEAAEAGRRLGHDLYQLSHLSRHADWPAPVLEGFDAAQARRLARKTADRFSRKWMQLRLGALRRSRVVAEDVDPALLQRLCLTQCPVTRETLTHGLCAPSDWSIDRLNNDGAYAASNLAVMSSRANACKGNKTFDEVLCLSQQDGPIDGLHPQQWLRLAVLMLGPCFATRHHEAPALPLCAPLPVCSVRLAMQQVQRLFTLRTERPSEKNLLVKQFRPACDGEASFRLLRHLGDTVHDSLKRLAPDALCWDLWLRDDAWEALLHWRASLSDGGWALAARISGELAGGQSVSPQALGAWRLPSMGYYAGHQSAGMPVRTGSNAFPPGSDGLHRYRETTASTVTRAH